MKKSQLALLAGAALAAGALTVPALGADAPTITNGCLTGLPADPQTPTTPQKICYTLFKPASASAENPVPMVFHSHGWGGSRSTSGFGDYMAAGMGVLSFDQRGFGESGGIARIEDPAFEGQDVKALIDFVAGLPWVAHDLDSNGQPIANDPVLGAIGGSYGGGYQFVGAFTEASEDTVNHHTRFNALAPEITWFSLTDSLAPAKVARTEWDLALTAVGARSLPTEIMQGLAFNLATTLWPQAQAPGVPDFDAFFDNNGPAFHVAKGVKLDIPVAFGQGITDNLFPLTQGIKNFTQALTPEARAKSVFVGYNSGHVLPQVVPLDNQTPAGDPCSQQLVGGSFGKLALTFLKKELKGVDDGLISDDERGDLHLATSNGGCTETTVDKVIGHKDFNIGTVATTTAAGAPLAFKVTDGPIRVAGLSTVTATVTAAGANSRGFFALGVGTSAADAKIQQGNVMPLNELAPVVRATRTFELPSVAFDVPAGQSLFLIASPVNDMFVSNGTRTPGALLLENTHVTVASH